jgi:AcrR family transcriptional regulator
MPSAKEVHKMGRPRSQSADQDILEAALYLVSERGYRAVSVDQIAAHAGVGKMSVYRRWPDKASLVMDALLELIGPETDFPAAATALESLKKQLHLQVKFFRGKHGKLIRSLVAEAQSNDDLAKAFRQRWLAPRRAGVSAVFKKALEKGELRADSDIELLIDMLYGPIYYRLLLGTGSLSSAFVEQLYERFFASQIL